MPGKPFALSVKARISNAHDQILLVRRSPESRGNPGRWELPGGKVDPGEDIGVALVREIQEELGVRVEPVCVLGATQVELPDRIVAYLILEARLDDTAMTLSDEHSETAWVLPDETAAMDLVPHFRPFVSR